MPPMIAALTPTEDSIRLQFVLPPHVLPYGSTSGVQHCFIFCIYIQLKFTNSPSRGCMFAAASCRVLAFARRIARRRVLLPLPMYSRAFASIGLDFCLA